MTESELRAACRAADEDTVAAALSGACVQLPLTSPVEVLEAFNCMIDVLTGERAQAEVLDEIRVARASCTPCVFHNDGPSTRAAINLNARIARTDI